MTVSSILDTASAGLRATQAGLDVVSQNVANSSSVGYTRRVLTTTETVAGNQGTGVNVVGVQRTLDTMLQKQLRLETAGAAYTSTMASAHKALDAAFDQTSGSASLSSLVNTFTSSLQTLAADPTTYQSRTAALSAASDLATSLNNLSGEVQTQRQSAENTLAQDVRSANDLLKQIASLNQTIVGNTANQSSAALLDQRDSLIDKLSSLMDISVRTNSSNSMTIATSSGFQLFDGQSAVTLSFDTCSPLMADSAYSTDPSKRGVGTITATDASGKKTDLIGIGAIKSGDMAAQIELRDSVLPQAQTQLDSLAAGLASALSDTQVAATKDTSRIPPTYSLDVSDLVNGQSATLTYADASGGSHTLTFVRADSTTTGPAVTVRSGPNDVMLDFSKGAAWVEGQINTALSNTPITNTGSGFNFVGSIASTGTAGVTAFTKTVAATATQNGTVAFPLFIDGGAPSGNNVYQGSAARTPGFTGLAARISVNPAVAGNPDLLVNYSSSTLSGDTTRPTFLLNQLTSATHTFAAATGIGSSATGFTGSFSDFAQQVISFQAAASISATNLNSGQQTVLTGLQNRYSEQAGVNIDTELTQLIQLQTAYSANARVLNAAKSLLDTLFGAVQ